MTEVSPVGRYQIIDPQYMTIPPPGQCALCGSHNRPVISMQLMVRFYGSVMFCLDCTRSMVTDLGGVIGVTSIENFRRVRDERNEFKAKVIQYETVWSKLHGDIDDLIQRNLDSVVSSSDSGTRVGDSAAENLDPVEVRVGEDSDRNPVGNEEAEPANPVGNEESEHRSASSNAAIIDNNRRTTEFFFGDLETSGQDSRPTV